MNKWETAVTNQDAYTEQRNGERLLVRWSEAVPLYARLVAGYGFLFGASIWLMAAWWNRLSIIDALVMSIPSGCVVAGFSGLVSIIVKDLFFPYTRPEQHITSLPRAAAPTDAKPRPFYRKVGTNMFYGSQKLEVEQHLYFARALIEQGERLISKRWLETWKIVNDRNGKEAQQIIDDLVKLEYVVNRGNNQYEAVDELVHWYSDMFPALVPPTQLNYSGGGGVA